MQTRRLSSQHESAPIAIPVRVSPAVPVTTSSPTAPLPSSAGKAKRPSVASSSSKRRLSSSSVSTLRPPGGGALLSRSVPVANNPHLRVDDDEDDVVLGASAAATGRAGSNGRPQLYECEKCSKVYRHALPLVKHRWEHTAHWKEASKLLLSKHQQVQLLEAAAILKAASIGSSLPEEKSYWPAAVSPPSSGLLGSEALNMHVLSSSASPRLGPARSLQPHSFTNSERDSSPLHDVLDEDDELFDQDDDDEDGGVESPSTGGDDLLADEMFGMDLDEPAVALSSRSPAARERSLDDAGSASASDSGYGSHDPSSGTSSAPSAAAVAANAHDSTGKAGKGPLLGYFQGRQSVSVVI